MLRVDLLVIDRSTTGWLPWILPREPRTRRAHHAGPGHVADETKRNQPPANEVK